jgi:hypothetical protein
MMDGGTKIAMDGGNRHQRQPNGQWDGGAIVMGDETATVQNNRRQCKSGAKGVWYFGLVFFC